MYVILETDDGRYAVVDKRKTLYYISRHDTYYQARCAVREYERILYMGSGVHGNQMNI